MTRTQKFNRVLLGWHKTHYRDMPWRKTSDPYRILVSEIMLQQTQVDRVRPKYAAFLKKFPTVHVLARAPLGDVLRLWSGLGYNRRAKHLQQCAKEVVMRCDGKFPETFEELVMLPGIGISTAGALLAFSFGKETAMIDTNIRRLLVRVFFSAKGGSASGGKIPSDKQLYTFAASIIPKGKGRVWNYAMLDLGATLCTARNHKDECPLAAFHGKVGDFVYKKPQKKFKGSRRFYRGKILSELSSGRTLRSKGFHQILGLSREQTKRIIAELSREGLLVQSGSQLRLPS